MSVDDDLEYHITFPPPTACPTSDHVEPVVVLFGWAGCSDRNLAKYSTIYEEKGCTTVRYIIPPKCILFGAGQSKQLKLYAQNLVNILCDYNLVDQPIFFHIFSNGGAMIYRHVSEIVQSDLKKFQIKGCIFDSAPAKVTLYTKYMVFITLIKGSTFKKHAVALLSILCLILYTLYYFLTNLFLGKFSNLNYGVYYTLIKEANYCPQLFLFSKADKLCSYTTIEQFIEMRKKAGADVRSVLYDSSEHVQHFVKYKADYKNHVYDFISCTLSLNKEIPNADEGDCHKRINQDT